MPPIKLSDHFSYRRLLRFTWPSMLMIVISSVYGVVDGVMVSNFAGTTPFAALNLIWPYIAILGSIGFMLGTGGSALVAKTLGEGSPDKARGLFSMITYSAIAFSVIMGLCGLLSVRSVACFLGAHDEMLENCVTYGSILMAMLPFCVLQIFFQPFMIAAERPKLAMWVTIGAGLTNVALDLLLIGKMGWGLAGAAWATGASQAVGTLIPLAYFALSKKCTLRLGRGLYSLRALGQACYNGVSEFVMQISMSFVSMLYCYQLLREAGETGVAAYGILMYFAFTFLAINIGYGLGMAPVVSFHYGAGNKAELRSLLHKSLWLMTGSGITMLAAAELLAQPVCAFFVGYDPDLLQYTVRAFRIYSCMYLVCGFNTFSSAFFTALNNGFASALISLLRTLVFEAGCVMLLPIFFGIDGIWWSVTVAEASTMLISFVIILFYRRRYGY